MAWVRLVLPVLACLLLAAHFYRAQQLPLALLSALLPLLLAVPRAWAVRVLQVALVLGAIEWLRTLAAFSAERIAMGQPYLRLTLICWRWPPSLLPAHWCSAMRACGSTTGSAMGGPVNVAVRARTSRTRRSMRR